MDFSNSVLLASISLVMVLILLAVTIPFLLTLQNCLKAISPQNRRMPPGQVWLLFVPFFNLVWEFFVVIRIAESIEAEYTMRGLESEPKPTQNIGIASNVLAICSFLPVIGGVASLAALVCWIIYWVKVADHKNRIASLPPYLGNESSVFGSF